MAKLIVTNPDQTKNKYEKFIKQGSVEDYFNHLTNVYRITKPIVGEKDTEVRARVRTASKNAIMQRAGELGIEVSPEHHTRIDTYLDAAMAHRNKVQKGFKSKFGVTESDESAT